MYDHPDWLALLQGILADPLNDLPRLVAADWLEEHDELQRARFIRVQCELAQMMRKGEGHTRVANLLRLEELAFLDEAAIEHCHWAATDCPGLVTVMGESDGLVITGRAKVSFRRGFVEVIHCRPKDWLEHGQAILVRAPIQELSMNNCCLDQNELTAILELGTLTPIPRVAVSQYTTDQRFQLMSMLPSAEFEGGSFTTWEDLEFELDLLPDEP